MVVTVHLKDPVASWVQARASAQNVSPEDVVHDILANERERAETSEEWQELNRRRLALIQKEYYDGLTHQEESELEALQRAADRHLETRDRQLLANLDRLRQAATAATN